MRRRRAPIKSFSAPPAAWVHPDGTVKFDNCTMIIPLIGEYADRGSMTINGVTYALKNTPAK